jgi:hypothetical protein
VLVEPLDGRTTQEDSILGVSDPHLIARDSLLIERVEEGATDERDQHGHRWEFGGDLAGVSAR